MTRPNRPAWPVQPAYNRRGCPGDERDDLRSRMHIHQGYGSSMHRYPPQQHRPMQFPAPVAPVARVGVSRAVVVLALVIGAAVLLSAAAVVVVSSAFG